MGQDSDPEEAQGLEFGREVGTVMSPPTEAGDMPTPLENPSIEFLTVGSLGLDDAVPEWFDCDDQVSCLHDRRGGLLKSWSQSLISSLWVC